MPERSRKPRPRQYKIQEVIKRRQVLLVQVVKEERGNKGAALTTYLSLAGRYSVLMPNTARGGGISRKITTPLDRKRLKAIAQELEVPEGMGVILRTAGANRTKSEIKRDFEYLLRLWENVRELTLRSTAPKLVYEEGSLIKRSIRDLYSREIDQVVVAGDDAYREAKDFMRMLMPSHARNVQLYKDAVPIFARNGVEAQLDAMFSPQVTLKSGGYIVINQTEALVSIDVNSGRSTREHSIEDTALNTNLEAAEEIARQLRLRDLAGPHRHRLHRHGGEAQQPLGRAQAQGLPARRPRAHPGRAHLAFRADGDVAPAHPHRRARKLGRPLPALPRHRPGALGLLAVAADSARARGSAPAPQRARSDRPHARGGGALCAEPEAQASCRARGALRADDHASAARRRRTAPASRSSAALRSRTGRHGVVPSPWPSCRRLSQRRPSRKMLGTRSKTRRRRSAGQIARSPGRRVAIADGADGDGAAMVTIVRSIANTRKQPARTPIVRSTTANRPRRSVTSARAPGEELESGREARRRRRGRRGGRRRGRGRENGDLEEDRPSFEAGAAG